MAIYALVVAAGKGKRFKGKKQFSVVKRRPLITYCLEILEKNKKIDRIIIVAQKKDFNRCKNIVRKFNYGKVTDIIPGGKRRQDSVRNGLNAIRDQNGMVIIHDAARPMLSESIIDQGILQCLKHRCVTLGLPIRDTIKLARNKNVIRTISRDHLYQIQTPQFFDIKLLRNAYRSIKFSDLFTDEASIIEAYGAKVHILTGSRMNIKITDREDLEMVKRLLP